jgi:hypothetical protein
MSKDWAHSQLDAGGLVGLDAQVDENSTETMIARTYGAAVLGDRVIVRLTSERLVPAEDLSMEFLGLEGRAVSPPIAKQNRTALEFGHWALIHQPKYAKYALDLVKRMKAAARKAASKAGHAWDLYVAMAEELNKSVRHFLPPFWEQAARAYKELGNTTYAGRALTKALEAERVHSLEVDREHRRDAILEFTLSGCLTGKALTDYAKDLTKQFPPLEAYETYKDLVIRRTLGGMAPIASAASDLAKMAKAAKLDSNSEIEEVLQAMITSPAMARAPFQFWKSVKKQVGNIVARNPSFAVWLLVHTNAVSSYRSDSPVWEWIDLLEEWKVLPYLYLSVPASKLPQDVEIPGGRAGWFSRVASVESSPNKRVFELLEQMADVIRAEQQPLQLSTGYHRHMDVDILDMVLELGLEVCLPQAPFALNFDGWLRDTIDHPRRNSQLAHVCSDERFRTKLIEQIPELVKFQGDRSQQSWGRTLPARRSFEEAATGHDSIKQVWWEFIENQLTSLETGGLADFEIAQENLDGSCRLKTAEQFPELVERLKQIDFGACLQRTLVAGVMDEYGWDELDRTAESSRIPRTIRYRDAKVYWAYPFVCWLDNHTVHCVSPTTSTKCEILLKRDQNLLFAVPVGSQFAFVYYDSGAGWKTYLRWSSAPNQNHEQAGGYYHFRAGLESIVQVGVDGIFSGERVFREGDTIVPQAMANWYHDGQRYWRVAGEGRTNHIDLDGANTVSEIDPLTGKVIRESIPPFFEEALPPGALILWPLSHFMPKPSQSGISPLGEKDGLLGVRCVRRRDGAMESTGIDGRSWIFSQAEQPSQGFLAALAILNKPASDAYWIVANDGRLIDSETRKGFGFYQQKEKYFAGTPSELPLRFMHSLRVRCEKSSKALRSMIRSDADELLAAGEVEREARRNKEDPSSSPPEPGEATRIASKLFPAAPARLIKGIARIARVAADEKAAVQSLLKRLEPQQEGAATSPSFNTEIAGQGFKEFVLDQPSNLAIYYSSESSLGDHIASLTQYLSGQEIESLPKTHQFWFSLIEDLPSVVWRTFWKRAIREDGPSDLKQRLDGPWIHSLRLLAQSGLFDLPGSFSLFRCNYDEQAAKLSNEIREKFELDHDVLLSAGTSRYIAYRFRDYLVNYIYVLGYNSKGECKAPKQFTIDSAQKIEIKWKRKQIEGFINALAKLESLPLPSIEKLNAASVRLGLHPIGVALLWMGNLRTIRYGQEKLTKELREFYGWKVKDIQVALVDLQSVTIPDTLFSDCLKEPGYLLTKAGHNFDSMIDSLAETRRALAPFPAEISNELDRAFPRYYSLPLKEFNELMMAPQEAEFLKLRKLEFKLPTRQRSYNHLEVEMTPAPTFDVATAYSKLVKGISIINYRLPVGHAVRRQIPQVIESIRAFLDHPDNLLPVGPCTISFDAQKTDIETVIGKLAATMGKFKKDPSSIYHCETELFVLATLPPQVHCYFRTSKLKSVQDLQALEGILHPILQSYSNADNLLNPNFALRMRSASMTDLMECNRDPRIEEGLWEQYPLNSVPAMVSECSQQLKVDEMAAALYLQILALPDPTSANIKLWNGWSAKQIKSSNAALLEKELVVEAKRARAGRELFLPGGWEPLKSPNLPIETWKLPMFGYENPDRLRGGMAEFIVFEGPITSLFEMAWNRWKAGDVPAYAEAPNQSKKAKKK